MKPSGWWLAAFNLHELNPEDEYNEQIMVQTEEDLRSPVHTLSDDQGGREECDFTGRHYPSDPW